MPKSKMILNGDEFKTKTEKMVNLPQSYFKPSKTEKMQYLPRFYYNNYEKIDEGYLDYITITHGTILVELNLRPDTAFGYPTWKSVFGGYDFISDFSSNAIFLFNSAQVYSLDFYNGYFNPDYPNDISKLVYIDTFLPYIGSFYSYAEAFATEYSDNDRFANSYITTPTVKYMVLNGSDSSAKNTKIQLFNNNRAKVLLLSIPL
jgi:hypothetical protein